MKIVYHLFIMMILFSLSLTAQERGIKIVAKDTKGIPREVPLYNKSYGVIIGIDRYKNLDQNWQLKNAVSDAKGMRAVLSEKFIFDNFYEMYNENATKENILKTLQGDLSSINDQDAVFFFFAGHGYTQATQFGDEIGYIVPHDGSLKDNEMFKNISMVELRDNIAKTINAKHVFFVMDACYSGTLLKRGVDIKEKVIDYDYLKTITQTVVRQVLTAGGKAEQVLDGGYKNHSIFTGRLIERFEQAENYITASELGLYIPKKVINDALDRNHKQTPQFGNLLGEGDFVFICKSMQNVNSEDVLANELKMLQAENLKLENAKKDKDYQENLRKQEEIKRQMALLEEKKKLGELEKARKEDENKKALEEEKRKKELLAKIVEEKQKQTVIAEDMTYMQALNKISEIKTKISQIDKEYDEQKDKAIKLAVNESSRGEFETQQEYNQRLANNKLKRKQVSDEYEGLKTSNKNIYTNELNSITSRKYTIGKDRLTVMLGIYNVDEQYFPVTITEVTNDPCVKPNYADSKIYISRDDAKMLRENESLLDIKATLMVSAEEKLMIDRITLIDAANSKNYEFTMNMNISAEEAGSKYGTFTDSRDGKTYKTVKIGSQTWLAENLNFDVGSGMYCYDDEGSNCNKYGKLYTWEAAKRVVPPGWRLPSKSDFDKLLEYLDCKGNRYQQITNRSGFNALFGGYRYDDGGFSYVGKYARFWSSTEDVSIVAWNLYVDSDYQKAGMDYYYKGYAFSVRLVKD